MINVYEKLDLEKLGIDKTKFRDKAKKSISLGMNLSDNAVAFLQNKFIDKCNWDYFCKQFNQAISGDGNELMKMDAAKSSSLCSLLFFYNVKDEDGHRLKIGDTVYTKSYFEYKNKVFGNPSNMDVVLVGKNEEKKDAILFIECKFSEYLEHDKAYISSKYFNDPNALRIIEKMISEEILSQEKNNKFSAYYNGEAIYATGLKQIVSHYVGISNFKNKNFYSEKYNDDRDNIKNISSPIISFMEVLFDLGDDMKNYREASDFLIKNIIGEPKTFLASKTYQEILAENPSFKIDSKIKTYYKY